MPRQFDTIVQSMRRVLGVIGIVLLGAALAWAPIAAFTGDILEVAKLALIGVALLIVMRLLPSRNASASEQPDSSGDAP